MAERRYVTCGCTPGTDENGWHEQRSEACTAREKEVFALAVSRAMDFVAERRNKK